MLRLCSGHSFSAWGRLEEGLKSRFQALPVLLPPRDSCDLHVHTLRRDSSRCSSTDMSGC